MQETGEAFSPQKRTYSTSKYENSILFSVFVGHFCPSGSGSGFSFKMWIRIRIQPTQINADPCESGSTTLVSDPDSLNPDIIILLIRIRIHILNADLYPDPGGQNDPQIWKKVKNFHVLKCWMFSIEG